MQGTYECAVAIGLDVLGASSTLVAGQAAADSAMRAQHPPDRRNNNLSNFRDGFERGAQARPCSWAAKCQTQLPDGCRAAVIRRSSQTPLRFRRKALPNAESGWQ